MYYLTDDDPQLADLALKEKARLETTLNLIAAENHSPRSVMEALGSVFNTKTIEGYPGKRFHAGCRYADQVERLAIERGKDLFNAEYINVQPHSGTSANLAVYFSVLDIGDRILAMRLPHGGHLSHGHPASITSKCFDFKHYSVNDKTERIDYDEVRTMAARFRPRMIVAGASSYARLIDYQRLADIASKVSAYLLVDMAHIAGLVAAEAIPSPIPYSDFVTFTCYKTMMGGRGGVILCRKALGKKIDTSVFPGCQGTSPVNVLAAKALIFRLAMSSEFKHIQEKTIENAAFLSDKLDKKGYRIVSGGTDNHQVIVDLSAKGITGAKAETVLESVGIVTNRNVIPSDMNTSGSVSGIRLGTAALTARGMGKPEMETIAGLIDAAISNHDQQESLRKVDRSVSRLCKDYPVYDFNSP